MEIRGCFNRKLPPYSPEKEIAVPLGWFVISHRYVPCKRDRRNYHGKWFKISSEGFSVHRILRFSPTLAGGQSKDGEIMIDYVAWLALSNYAEKVPDGLCITIKPVSRLKLPLMATAHPDPNMRLAGWLALISVTLGLISLIIAFSQL